MAISLTRERKGPSRGVGGAVKNERGPVGAARRTKERSRGRGRGGKSAGSKRPARAAVTRFPRSHFEDRVMLYKRPF